MDKANDYFTHDAHALEDPKCMMLVSELGMEGYGMFWALIESLRRQEGYSLPVAMIPALAQRYNVTEAKLKTVIGSYGLFTILDGRVFFSESLNRRMEAIESASEFRKNRALEAAKKRWDKAEKTEENGAGKCFSNAIAMLKQCSSNAIALKPDNQVFTNSENIETPVSPYIYNNIYNNNNNIYNIKGGAGGKNTCFVKPTVEEVAAYVEEKKFDVDAAAFVAFYESKGWKVGRSPMVRWKQAVVTWQYRKQGGRANGKQQVSKQGSIYDDCLR